MRDRYAWLTFGCVLCLLLNVSLSRAADDEEHVHIKVRMPELVRKHPKAHKSPQFHHYKYHHHHYHKPQQAAYLHSQRPPNKVVKHSRRAIKPTAHPRQPPPLVPPPPRPLHPLTHNHLDMGSYGDNELGAGIRGFGDFGTGMGESTNAFRGGGGGGGVGLQNPKLLYSSSLPQKMPTLPDLAPNYGPALFSNIDSDGSNSNKNKIEQYYDVGTTTSMVTMPDASQQLMQHMELMDALAAAAAAAAGAAGGGGGDGDDKGEKVTSAGVGEGSGDSETNALLANDFLAELQRTYANSKYPATAFRRNKKKHRGGGELTTNIGDAAETYRINVAQQEMEEQEQQQQLQQQLLRQHYKQQKQQHQQQRPYQLYGANYITQQLKPQVLMYEAPASENNNNYMQHYKNKYYYNTNNNNNNDLYATTISDASNLGYANAPPIVDHNAAVAEGNDDEDEVDDIDDNTSEDNEDDDTSEVADAAPLFYTSRPISTATAADSPLNPLTTTSYNSISDYEDMTDDRQQQYDYQSNKKNKNHYHNNYNYNYEDDVNAAGGVNPVSYRPTTAYGAHTEPLTPATVSHLKLHRPYRQLQQQQQQQQRHFKQQQHSYNTLKAPAGLSGHQQFHQLQLQLQYQPQQQQQQQHQDFITTAQPINVIGPTASDFDEPQQNHNYTPPPIGLPRYKKRNNKNRIKAKLNRNRIPTQ